MGEILSTEITLSRRLQNEVRYAVRDAGCPECKGFVTEGEPHTWDDDIDVEFSRAYSVQGCSVTYWNAVCPCGCCFKVVWSEPLAVSPDGTGGRGDKSL